MWLILCLLGVAVGFFGTLIGAGGGFLLVPLLVLIYPSEQPSTITAISLTVVFFNALSGSVGYWVHRKVDVRSGLRFSAAAVPGAILGAIGATYISRFVFELLLSVLLFGAGFSMLIGGRHRRKTMPSAIAPNAVWGPTIEHPRLRGLAVSFVVGFVSSLLGIGGGIIHVPALVYALGFPVHVATATSHFVLATTAGTATLVHVVTGAFHTGLRRIASLGVGVIIGAQLGIYAARRTQPALIMRALAIALLLVSIRIFAHAVWPSTGP